MTTTTGPSSTIASPPARPAAPLALRILAGSAGSILAVALLPILLLMHVPFAGWAIGAIAVIANRALHALIAWLVRDSSITVVLGALGFSMFFRVLITGLALVMVGAEFGTSTTTIGLGRPDLAMPAIIVFILCYTVDAAIEAIRRTADRDRERALLANAAPPATGETPA